MTKYTSLQTSRKLHEAFPEWEDLDDWYGEYVSYGDLQSVAPKYNTDYLLDKLPKSLDGRQLNAWYEDDCTTYGYGRDVTVWHQESELPVEALALLALKLKEKGIL